ncbi:hypothetical protein MJ1HA_0958 [Metallosphaera sedula]|nr:hypothetical protein MJ1HA_0958 [Metallosphaera sedula]
MLLTHEYHSSAYYIPLDHFYVLIDEQIYDSGY